MNLSRLPEYRKLLTFLLTVLGNAMALGLVPQAYLVWAFLAVNSAGAYGIWRLPNAEKEAE